MPWSRPEHEEQRSRLFPSVGGACVTPCYTVFLRRSTISQPADVVGDESGCRCLKLHLLLLGGFPSRRHKCHLVVDEVNAAGGERASMDAQRAVDEGADGARRKHVAAERRGENGVFRCPFPARHGNLFVRPGVGFVSSDQQGEAE
jgi:hypothetical protein